MGLVRRQWLPGQPLNHGILGGQQQGRDVTRLLSHVINTSSSDLEPHGPCVRFFLHGGNGFEVPLF